MAKKVSKFFRIGVEGDTCDGRVISAQDIQEMAETFDPRVYGCRINAYFHERRSLNNFHRDRVITFEQIAE